MPAKTSLTHPPPLDEHAEQADDEKHQRDEKADRDPGFEDEDDGDENHRRHEVDDPLTRSHMGSLRNTRRGRCRMTANSQRVVRGTQIV